MPILFILSQNMARRRDGTAISCGHRHGAVVCEESDPEQSNDEDAPRDDACVSMLVRPESGEEVLEEGVKMVLLKNIAMGLYPHVENELASSTVPSGKNAVIRARNRLCDTSQCMTPDVAYKGNPYLSGNEMK